jgi:hypothetical protein
VGNYLDYRMGKRERGTPKTNRVAFDDKGRLLGGVVPFSSTAGTIAAETPRKGAYITIWSAANVAPSLLGAGVGADITPNFGGITFTGAQLGFVPPSAVVSEDSGFYSAQLVLRFAPAAATASRPTSGITGDKYSYRPTEVVTVPFGKVAATDNIQTRVIALANEFNSPVGGKISYQVNPEKQVGQRNVGAIA